MPSLRKQLGLTIRRLRSKAGYSQEAFGDLVGLHRTYMGSVERGERNVSIDNIERIASALGITAGQLLTETEKNSRSATLDSERSTIKRSGR
jgi:transcriptional regulator with XRE-family HTH domain